MGGREGGVQRVMFARKICLLDAYWSNSFCLSTQTSNTLCNEEKTHKRSNAQKWRQLHDCSVPLLQFLLLESLVVRVDTMLTEYDHVFLHKVSGTIKAAPRALSSSTTKLTRHRLPRLLGPVPADISFRQHQKTPRSIARVAGSRPRSTTTVPEEG